jgi:ribosomal protein S18 acetylase RimI-like enzyme
MNATIEAAPQSRGRGTAKGAISRRATVDDAARIARLFAAAFARDPVFDWLARPGARRAHALQRFFYWVLRERSLPHGETWMSEDGFSAAAWIPPYPGVAPATLREELRLLPVILGLTGVSRFSRGTAMAAALEGAHPREPYFYLAFIGVAPRFQGSGLGTRLLEETLARIDAAGAAAFLENSHPRNLKLYQRMGFEVVREVVARPDAPPLYAMWRPARGTSSR